MLGRCEGGEQVECQGLGAQGAGAEDEGEDDLQFSQGLVEGHPGAGAFGSVLIMALLLLVYHGWSAGRAASLRGKSLLAATLMAAGLGVVMILLKEVVLRYLH